jgi:hypothetical protein
MMTEMNGDRLDRIEKQLERLLDNQDELKTTVAALMSRPEIEAALASRVSLDAHQAVLDRLTKLENRIENEALRAVQKWQVWAAIAIGCTTIFTMVLTIIVTIWLHFAG